MITDVELESYVQNVSLPAGALARSGIWCMIAWIGCEEKTERMGGENGGSSGEMGRVVGNERDLRRATGKRERRK